MRDVLARLMQWMETSDIDDADIVLRDAITEIAGLRARLDEHRLAIRRLAEQDATLSVQGGVVTVTADATLTDEEREALNKMRVHLYEISRDNAFIDEVCDDAKAACEAIAAFLNRYK